MHNWKSTANGVLSFFITTLTTLSGFMVATNLIADGASVHSIHIFTWVAIGINVALALCRAWVGLLQNDAPLSANVQTAINQSVMLNATATTAPKP